MTRLLICGSRKASDAMIYMTDKAVERAGVLGWSIIVGDAFGVDQAVAYACIRYMVPCNCYGITDTPRNHRQDNSAIVHWERIGTYTRVPGNYLARDRVMVEKADRVLAIWNGLSRGTKYTYDYAVRLHKEVALRIPDRRRE